MRSFEQVMLDKSWTKAGLCVGGATVMQTAELRLQRGLIRLQQFPLQGTQKESCKFWIRPLFKPCMPIVQRGERGYI
jgi:hypothetical protein